jgi:long-chain acyl-CoA synthetase
MLSHENLVENARGKLDAVPQFASDRRLNILPFSHAYARTCELSTWALTGGSMTSVSSYDQLSTIGPRFEPTLINAVPSVFQRLEQELEYFETIEHRKRELTSRFGSRLRCLASGGAGLATKTFHFFRELGLPIIQGYGLTEASPVVCSNRSDHPLEDCVGPPILNTEIHIDADQKLFVKGPGVMLGYWNQPSATERRIKNGWLDTGDRAERLPDGSLRILGRTDDRITLSTGYKVDPAAFEQRLVGQTGIRNAMLVGNGQRFLVAIIVVADSDQENGLLESIREALVDCPDYCIPKRLIIETADWTVSSGMVNHKGGLRRDAIAEHYRHAIAAAYCSTLRRKQIALDPSNRDQQGGDGTEQGNEVQQ